MVRLLAGTLLLGLALLAATTVAAGQGLSVEDRVHAEPIEPLGEPVTVALNVTAPCPENATGTLQVTGAVTQAPGYVNLTVEAPSVVVGEPCSPGETIEVALPVRAVVTQHAPAFSPFTATLTVETRFDHAGGHQPADRWNATAALTLTPSYFNLYNVRLDKKIAQAGPQEAVAYPIFIENHSNGPTRFEFSLVSPDGAPAGFQAVLPEPVVLQATPTGGTTTSTSVVFTVYTPYHNGYVNDVGALQLEVESFYAEDTSIQGASSQVSTLTQARGWYVPGPGTVLAAVGLLGAAAVGRRRVHR